MRSSGADAGGPQMGSAVATVEPIPLAPGLKRDLLLRAAEENITRLGGAIRRAIGEYPRASLTAVGAHRSSAGWSSCSSENDPWAGRPGRVR